VKHTAGKQEAARVDRTAASTAQPCPCRCVACGTRQLLCCLRCAMQQSLIVPKPIIAARSVAAAESNCQRPVHVAALQCKAEPRACGPCGGPCNSPHVNSREVRPRSVLTYTGTGQFCHAILCANYDNPHQVGLCTLQAPGLPDDHVDRRRIQLPEQWQRCSRRPAAAIPTDGRRRVMRTTLAFFAGVHTILQGTYRSEHWLGHTVLVWSAGPQRLSPARQLVQVVRCSCAVLVEAYVCLFLTGHICSRLWTHAPGSSHHQRSVGSRILTLLRVPRQLSISCGRDTQRLNTGVPRLLLCCSRAVCSKTKWNFSRRQGRRSSITSLCQVLAVQGKH
jgi:hypothetical protein